LTAGAASAPAGTADAWAAIDWQAPWLAPMASPGRAAAAAIVRGATVAEALNACATDETREAEGTHTVDRVAGVPATATATVTATGARAAQDSLAVPRSAGARPGPRFVPAGALPAGEPYERFVFATGRVPTRCNLHDFFNGLAWRAFPSAKARLNRLQAEEIAASGIGGRRGAVRDAITLLDENGALLQAPDALRAALAARDWRALFVTHRARWAEARLWLFGHALMEQLVRPRKSLTAHVLLAPPALEKIASVDGWMADALTPGMLAAKPFLPLPVLGVPGWWPENASPDFYDDAQVFRPARARPADRPER
jgi:hypothetical protein